MTADPEDIAFAVQAVLGGSRWYEVIAAEPVAESLRLTIRVPGDERVFAVDIAAPWSDLPQPWLYATPIDLGDWAAQLHTWLEEEFATLAVQRATLFERDGVTWFECQPYGFRVSDEADHARFLEIAPNGWYGDERAEARGLPRPRRPGFVPEETAE